MSDKKSIKGIAIIFLIIANIALIIALCTSVMKAVNNIEIGKEIDTSTKENETEENIGTEANNQETNNEEETNNQETNYEEDTNNQETSQEEQQNKEEGALQRVLAQMNNQNTSIVEIILVFIGIGLFIMGAILLRIAKKMN